MLDLSRADLIDQWSEHPASDDEKLPRYKSLHDKPCRTRLAQPLKHAGQKLGVLVVEFSRVISITAGALREADFLARTFGRILWLQDSAESQME